jgi:AcrR family transcriptional regulator
VKTTPEILRAALEELARADYGGLTIERVATRAGVNKTTVYRQWPTKADLIRAALESVAEASAAGPSTGTLRGDLLQIGRRMLAFASSFEGQGIVRLRLLEHPEPELAEIAKSLNERYSSRLRDVLREAVTRRELSPDIDVQLLLDMLGGALHVRLFLKNERVDDVVIARIVDVLIDGAGVRKRGPARGKAP